MKKTIIMGYGIISLFVFIIAFFLLLSAFYDFSDFIEMLKSFESKGRYVGPTEHISLWALLWAFSFTLPFLFAFIPRISFEGESAEISIFLHNIGRRNIDSEWNSQVFLSEIVKVDVVRLTPEERKTCVSHRHLRNKYLKIQLKYGKSKYVYAGKLFNSQIRKVISLLTTENPYIPQRR